MVSSGKITLYNEDCLDGMRKRIAPGSVDVIVTSPPYNIGVGYRSYNDRIPRREYLEWTRGWAIRARDCLKNDGSLFLNIGSKPTSPEVPFQVAAVFIEEFSLQNMIHWIKSIYIESDSYGERVDLNIGHYKPINSKRFLNDNHEYVFHFTKTGRVEIDRLALGVPYKDKSNITRWKSAADNKRCRGNCWFIPYRTIQSRAVDRPHPASFPSRLAENCIRLHGLKRNLTVLDPFMGLGSTAVACRKLGVAFAGFETDPHYFEEAQKRLNQPDCEK